jgi:hypothetical protein
VSATVDGALLAALCTSLVLPVVPRPGLATQAAPARPRRALSASLAALALDAALSCTLDGVFERRQISGLQWDALEGE